MAVPSPRVDELQEQTAALKRLASKYPTRSASRIKADHLEVAPTACPQFPLQAGNRPRCQPARIPCLTRRRRLGWV
jgi:hypothetical protein